MNIEEVKIRWKIAIDRGTIEALTHSLTHSLWLWPQQQ